MAAALLCACAAIASEAAPRAMWIRRFAGPGRSVEQAIAVQIDTVGNTFVAARSDHNDGLTSDFATVKYAPDGALLWSRTYNATGTGYDFPTALSLDSNGNALVVGQSTATTGGGSHDLTVLKYSPTGVLLWASAYAGPNSADDFATALAVDGSGNSWVTGGSANDYVTVKFDSGGRRLWFATYDGPDAPGTGADVAQAIAVDADGNAYVSGNSWLENPAESGRRDYATLKYAADGRQLWARRTAGSSNGLLGHVRVAADGNGGAWIATAVSPAGIVGPTAMALTRFGSSGNVRWSERWEGSEGASSVSGLAIDSNENAFVTGTVADRKGHDYATIKFDSDGHELWETRYDGDPKGPDAAAAIAVDSDGNSYVTGSSSEAPGSGSGFFDWATVKYSSDGEEMWSVRHGDVNVENAGSALALDHNKNLVVVGSVYSGTTTLHDLLVVKYSPLVLSTPENLVAAPIARGRIQLTWQDTSDRETGFELERRTEAGIFTLLRRLPAGSTSWTDGGLPDYGTFSYRVRTVAGTERSNYSNEVVATAPGPPLNISLSASKATAAQGETIALSWFVSNPTNHLAASVELRLPLPAHALFVSGTAAGVVYEAASRVFTWHGALAQNQRSEFRFLVRVGTSAPRGSAIVFESSAKCADFATGRTQRSVTVRTGLVPVSVVVRAEGTFDLLDGEVFLHDERGTPPLHATVIARPALGLWLGVRSVTPTGSFVYPRTIPGVIAATGLLSPEFGGMYEARFDNVDDELMLQVGMTEDAALMNILVQLWTAVGAKDFIDDKLSERLGKWKSIGLFARVAKALTPLPRNPAAWNKALKAVSVELLKASKERTLFRKARELLKEMGVEVTEKVLKKAFSIAFRIVALSKYLADVTTLIVATGGNDLTLRFVASPNTADLENRSGQASAFPKELIESPRPLESRREVPRQE